MLTYWYTGRERLILLTYWYTGMERLILLTYWCTGREADCAYLLVHR